MHQKFSLTILYLAATVGSFSSILNGQQEPALPPDSVDTIAPSAPDAPRMFATAQSLPFVVGQHGNRTDQALAKAIEKYRKTESDSDARRQAKDEIAKLLGEKYDAYMKDQEKHLDQMEKKLAKLREQLKLRKDGKQKMVGLKLEMVMAQIEGLGWPEQSSGGWLASPLQSRYHFETSDQNTFGLLAPLGNAAPSDDDESMEVEEEVEAEAPRPARDRAINRAR